MFDWFKRRGRKDCTHGPLKPDEDVAIARAELAGGDLKHAAHHVACALGSDPNRPEWLDLLNQISDVSRDPLELAPLGDKNYFATVAMRAYLLHRLNRLNEGLGILFQVVMIRPDVPYLDWALRWLREPEAQGRLEAGPFQQFLLEVVQNLPSLTDPERNAGPTLERIPAVLRAAREAGLRDTHFLFLSASAVRRLGHREEALEIAREAYRLEPGYTAAVALASALREMGETEAALDAYRTALQHDPEDCAARLDMGDMLWDAGAPDGSERYYREVLEREAEHPWALPSYFALQHQRTGDDSWAEKLEQYAAAHPENDRARALMREYEPYFGHYLPDPADAIVNVARQVAEKFEQEPSAERGGSVNVTVNYLEAPSAVMTVREELRRISDLELGIKVKKVQKPDPRQPRGRVEFQLWRYRGNDAEPALPPPPPAVAEAIAALAKEPYHFAGWRGRAAEVAAGLAGAPVEQVLAVMVHPPAPPEGIRMWTWVTRVQTAVALVVAALDSGWRDSGRRRALLAVARGPMDWSVSAALVALAGIAEEDPAAEKEIAELYRELVRGAPREGYLCYLEAVAVCALRLPNPDPGGTAYWDQVLAASRAG